MLVETHPNELADIQSKGNQSHYQLDTFNCCSASQNCKENYSPALALEVACQED